MLHLITICLLAYVIGSIPNGLILGKLIWNTDLRQYGSRNIGATNAWRVLGKGPGTIIFLLDFLKGLVGSWLGLVLSGEPIALVTGGLFAILGHSCSLFLRFKGGKGVATGLGAIAMMMPLVTLIVFLVWFAIVYKTRYVSLGSIVAAALVPLAAFLTGSPNEYVYFGLAAAILIIVRHHANISRLIDGTENKIKV